MTVAAELAKAGHRMEYILCIEGHGWPDDETSANGGSAGGFNGTVWCVHDFLGTMAADLEASSDSLTVKTGRLRLPDAVSEELDPVTCEYRVGAMDFSILDDGYMAARGPHVSPTEDVLDIELQYDTVDIHMDDGNFVEGDVVVIGGVELVLLGARSGTYLFSGCTRGYLGSRRGRMSKYLDESEHDARWPVGTAVQSTVKFLHGRRVRLYAHVPGEAKATASMLLYSGAITGLDSKNGMTWNFQTTGQSAPVLYSKRQTPVWFAEFNQFVDNDVNRHTLPDTNGSGEQALTEATASQFRFAARVKHHENFNLVVANASRTGGYDEFAIAAQYCYRTEPGGTVGMIDAWDDATSNRNPQARNTSGDDADVLDSYLLIGDAIMHAVKKRVADPVAYDLEDLLIDPFGPNGEFYSLLPQNADVRFLLDNIGDEAQTSRYAVNNDVKRNPVDFLLIHLTSMPHEFAILSTTVDTHTTTLVTTGTYEYPDDLYVGFALHCVEGANKGRASIITGHTSGGNETAWTVSPPFPNAPDAGGGEEYQIRNTIYDVLPISWGLGLHNAATDVDSFEAIRDAFFGDAELGRFVLGVSDIDLLELLRQEVMQPYGLMLYQSRLTGKTTLRYIGEILGDGVIQDYTPLLQASIHGFGDIDMGVSVPVGSVKIKTRPSVVGVVGLTNPDAWQPAVSKFGLAGVKPIYGSIPSVAINGQAQVVEIVSPELEEVVQGDKLQSLEISAMFNSVDDLDFVVGLAVGRIRRFNTPPPSLPIRVSFDMLAYDIQPGALLTITHDGIFNPYTGEVGLTSQVARVLSSKISLSDKNPGVELVVELLESVTGARIAPAATVISKTATDGFGARFNCNPSDFVNDTVNDRDYYPFQVDDYVELRSVLGVVKQAGLKIIGFGTNQVSDPTLATESGGLIRIYVNAAITATVATDDYLTLDVNASFTRGSLYSEFATSALAVTTGTTRHYG